MGCACRARRSALSEIIRAPVKRQMTMTLARPSIALSRPKATKAIDPAKIPATTPTAPSIPSQTSVSVGAAREAQPRRAAGRNIGPVKRPSPGYGNERDAPEAAIAVLRNGFILAAMHPSVSRQITGLCHTFQRVRRRCLHC